MLVKDAENIAKKKIGIYKDVGCACLNPFVNDGLNQLSGYAHPISKQDESAMIKLAKVNSCSIRKEV